MKRTRGVMPFAGRVPAEAERKLLNLVAEDLSGVIDKTDRRLAELVSGDWWHLYGDLDSLWGAVSINLGDPKAFSEMKALYLLSSMLKKFVKADPTHTKQRRKAAIDKMLLAEKLCYAYNREGYRSLTWSDDPQVQAWFGKMQRFILEVIGPWPDTNKVQRYARHGTGASTTHKSMYGHRYYKYANVPYAVTTSAMTHAKTFINNDERWVRALNEHVSPDSCLFDVRERNRIEFVPKSAKEDRPIACENAMNLLLQLGVDGFIRNRLKRRGVDINDQSINQRLAREGSITGDLATLDLSMASDTVSIALVDKLFPRDWALYLHDLRAVEGTYKDIDGVEQVITYNKFSSMGNGYTFALETLIFSAAVAAMGSDIEFGKNAHVYGDDIIMPTKYAPALIKLLNLCGFVVNTEKSFYTGYTRESCGTDWYHGKDIRPFFVREPLCEMDAFGAFTLINSLTEWFESIGMMPDQLKSRKTLMKWLHPQLHLYGPYAKDISAYICSPTVGKRTKNGHYSFDVAIAKPRKFNKDEEGLEYFRLLANSLSPYETINPYEYKFARQFSNLGAELSFLKEASATLGLRGLANPFANLIDGLGSQSQFDVTRRGEYSVEVRTRGGRSFDWPTMFAWVG